MKFGVITGVPPLTDSGNLATAVGEIVVQVEQPTAANKYAGRYEEIPFPTALALHRPVFWVGEVLILDDNGREIPYPGRKPSKWSVECEEFDKIEDALARAAQSLNEEH
jgi:hypothetical protein